MIPLPAIGDPSNDPEQTNAPKVGGIIRPPAAYSEPIFTTVIIPANTWTPLLSRDMRRAAVVIFRTASVGPLLIQPGSNTLAVPITIDPAATTFSLLYADFLTIVTGEIYGWSGGGETVTVGAVRLN